ncbi:MAG: 16S rRNA (cytosine(1402)-N(4))-methyltransferase RsmH [Gemmatimonadota bacterium]|nr:16S rRNA (cytosine(1402)-N(4))-methyltransferase RsmH [Gemmatimonadota bacterium]
MQQRTFERASRPPEEWASAYHAPVCVAQVLGLLQGCVKILDGTLGGGGHAHALLEQGAMVTALDRDPQAVMVAAERLKPYLDAGRLRIFDGSYALVEEIDELANEFFDGVLLDLGVSSHQLDDDSRGFSFRPDAPLDMRMEGAGESAADVLNLTDESALSRIFREYGDEPRAGRLAREVVRRRSAKPFCTSNDFVGAIRATLGSRSGAPDFARLFQAVRIATNNELGGLATALPHLRDKLVADGVVVVISYHSGEDRIVKNAFRDWSAACICPARHPICTCRGHPLGELLTRRGIVADELERATNPRARSARLRAWRNGG